MSAEVDVDLDVVQRPKALAGSFAQAPWPLVVVAGLVLLAGLTMTFMGAVQSGISVDEAGHVSRLNSFIDDGLYVRDHERRRVAEGAIPPNAYVYGPATARVMHGLNQLAGNETDSETSTTAAAYAVRHLAIAAMWVVSAIAVFGTAWLMLGSWRWGVVAAAALAAIPMWTGHAMFNPKDTPVGVGYALMTFAVAGLVMAARWDGRRRFVATAGACLGIVFGTALMLGTRPGMWPALALATVIAVGFLAAARALDRWTLVGLFIALAGSYATLWAIYPRIYRDPIVMLKVSLSQSTAFPQVLPPGRSYVFKQTAIEWPLLLLGFLIIGTAISAWLCFRLLRKEPQRAVAFALVGAHGFALTVAAIMSKAALYDGLRQLLFAVPGQALLATVGIAAVIGVGRAKLTRIVLVTTAVLALVLPTTVQARLYPYQYAYGNVAAELAGAPILDDTWKVSFREHIEEIPPNIKATCINSPPPTGPISDRGSDCRGSYGVIKAHWLAYWHQARYSPDSPIFYTVLRAHRPVPTNCRVLRDVTRMRHFERVIMSRLLLCKTDYPSLHGPGPAGELA